MRYILAGLAQFLGVAVVIRYANQPDSYYQDGTTHWEHASKDAAATWAAGAITVSSAIALMFLAMGLVSRWRRGRFAAFAAAAYLISLFVAWFALTVGH
jgi:hypothetical protein